jgi:AraC-like DNA-binding protein
MITTRIVDLPSHSATHAHPEHQLIVGLEGAAEFEVMGKGGMVSRLHACLVPGCERHAFSGRGDNHMLILDLDPLLDQTMPGEGGDGVLDRLFEQPRFVRLDLSLQGVLDLASRHLVTAADGVSPLGWHLGGVLLHALHDRLFSTSLPLRPLGTLNMAPIEDYIARHLEQSISVADLAAVACVSPSHFHALFRQSAGMSPHQFVLETRVREARRLLVQTRLPVADIADRCGFSSQSALTHSLRQRTGQTPGQVRRQAVLS